MADSRDAASELMRRDVVRGSRESVMRAPSRDGTTEGRRSTMSGERPNTIKRTVRGGPPAGLDPKRVPFPRPCPRTFDNPPATAAKPGFPVLILTPLAGGLLSDLQNNLFKPPGPLDNDKIVNIPPRL